MKLLKIFLSVTLIFALAILITSCAMGTTTQACNHLDRNKDGKCDKCSAAMNTNTVCEHVDDDHDGECDECGEEVDVEHIDDDEDGFCDECDEELAYESECTNHSDTDHDGKCNVCDATITGACTGKDANGDGYCDSCYTKLPSCTKHKDNNKDGKCDICLVPLSEESTDQCDECVDENGDGTCDECGSDVEISAPSCDCVDANRDGKCDICKEEMNGAILLYGDGKMNFNFVLASGSKGAQLQAVDKLVSELKKYGITVTMGEDKAASAAEYEVFFNSPTARGDEYKLDPHDYGPEGYAVQIIGNKIIIVSGSDDTFTDAITAFKEQILGITEDTKKLTTKYIYTTDSVVEIQDNYKVDTITLFGEDIKGYTIAVDKTDTAAYPTAQALQKLLYSKSGYWLDIVPLEEAGKSIVIAMAPRNYENDGYSATFTEGRMDFIAEYPTVIQTKTLGFFTSELAKAEGTLDITAANNFTADVRYVYYRDYGAVGDGVTDDSEAIRDAHTYANEGGHKVYASAGARYYIGKIEKTIYIKTDVDWLDAKFILDDMTIAPLDKIPGSTATYRSVNVFTVSGDSSVTVPGLSEKIKEINAAGGLDASTFTSFNLNFGRPMLLQVNNVNHMNYIRYGVNASDGAKQAEVVLVDENGNVDPTTPFMFDFEEITSIGCYPTDDEPITIEGGVFYTRPYYTDTPQAYNSYGRGIACGRSNVTFKNVQHYLENEGTYDYNNHDNSTDYGCPYGGFYTVSLADNVVYDSCVTSAHIVYKGSNGAGMGTYDIDPGKATNILYVNCTQTNENFNNLTYSHKGNSQNRWGVMGSSYCKNVTFLDSKLTRFDAHNGIHNASIINTEIKMIRIDGTGTFLMEGSTMYNNTFIGLREDYGGYWHGSIILKDNKIITGNSSINLFTNTWYNHDFGYPATYANNIIIDNLQILKSADGTPSTATVNLFGSGILSGATNAVKDYLPATTKVDGVNVELYYKDGTPVMLPNKCQVTAPERIIIRNCDVTNWIIPTVEQYPWFENTTFEINENTECVKHFDIDGDLKCDDCGADFTPCTEHVDNNNDGSCCYCFADVAIKCDKHEDKDLNGKCDICSAHYVCEGHVDEDNNRICDECGGVLGCKGGHEVADSDGLCTICKKLIPKCEKCVDEAPHDSKCDVCKADMVALKAGENE